MDSTTLFTRFLDNSQGCTFVGYDSGFTVTRCNQLFENVIGLHGDSLVGRSIKECISPDSLDLLIAPASELELRQKIHFVDRSGQARPLHCYLVALDREVFIIGEKLMHTESSILNTMSSLNNDLANLTRELQRKNKELEHANETIRTLRGIIPICSHCKVVRNDEGYWKEVEVYVAEHTEALFSHSICPKCMDKYYSDI